MRFAIFLQLAVLAIALLALGGHHLAGLVSLSLVSFDHLGAICLVALHQLLQPIHSGFHLLLGAGCVYAVYDRSRAWLSSRRIMRVVQLGAHSALSPKLAQAAAAIQVPSACIRVVPDLPVPAFTAGWLRPRIYVASDTEAFLNVQELQALLAHEHHHVRQRDPLTLFMLRFVGSLLFWLPGGAQLGKVAAEEAELAADDAAARCVGRVQLAHALLRIAQRFTRGAPQLTAPIHSPDLLEIRIARLIDARVPGRRPRRTHWSLTTGVLILLLVVLSGGVMAHPETGHGSHCEHQDGSPLRHLACKFNHSGRNCPHAPEPRHH